MTISSAHYMGKNGADWTSVERLLAYSNCFQIMTSNSAFGQSNIHNYIQITSLFSLCRMIWAELFVLCQCDSL